MALDPRDRLDKRRETIETELDDPVRGRLLEYSHALDSANSRYTYEDAEGRPKTYAPRTIDGYLGSLLNVQTEHGLGLCEATADGFMEVMIHLKDDLGRSGVTVAKYQSAAKAFYRYHADLGVDPDDIDVDSEQANVRYDEQDLYTEEEIWALRDACNGPKQRALLELLIYTGQRITALLTLKVKDIDLESGDVYLNDEYDEVHGGLKGALNRGRRRKLLGSKKYVADWFQYHPHRNEHGDWPNSDEWLFVGDPSNPNTAVGDHWSDSSARQTLHRIADRAGTYDSETETGKSPNCHNFRHFAATTLYRDWDWDEAEIKAQLGLAENSDIFETTYNHITDAERLESGAAKFHGSDGEEDEADSLTPPTCPSCSEVLKPHWTACPNPSCTERFGPGGDTDDGRYVPLDEVDDEMVNVFNGLMQGFAREASESLGTEIEWTFTAEDLMEGVNRARETDPEDIRRANADE